MTPETNTKRNRITGTLRRLGDGVGRFAQVVSATPMPGDFGNPARLKAKENAYLTREANANSADPTHPTRGITIENQDSTVEQGVAGVGRQSTVASEVDPTVVKALEDGRLIGRDFSVPQPSDPLPRFFADDK